MQEQRKLCQACGHTEDEHNYSGFDPSHFYECHALGYTQLPGNVLDWHCKCTGFVPMDPVQALLMLPSEALQLHAVGGL